jgi:hypothetical protein
MEPAEQAIEQALTAGTEAFLQHLTERARGHNIPIEATLWQPGAAADLVELTVVSRRKAYIFSLPVTDLADPSRAAFRQEIIGLVLTAIKENLPLGRGRIPPPLTERDRVEPTPQVLKKSTSSYTAFKERVEATVTDTQETVARIDQAIDRTRKTLQRADELFQRMAARRERDAEQPRPTYQVPRPKPQETNPPLEPVPPAKPPDKN